MCLYFIEKTFDFEASHRLRGLIKCHPCSSLHGHSYKVKVYVEKQHLDAKGMVIDFGDLKPFGMWLKENFDHAVVVSPDDDELIEFLEKQGQKIFIMPNTLNVTAENMARLFAEKVKEMFPDLLERSIRISVQETENNIAGYIM